MIAIPFVLTFPGAFAPTGLLGAGPQSAAWLSFSIRFIFAVATLGYALLISGNHPNDSKEPSPRSAILWSVTVVTIAVCALVAAVTVGQDFMPRLLDANGVLPLGRYAMAMTALIYVSALWRLWSEQKSVLNIWLMVAICALIAETASVALLPAARFNLGFYAYRLIFLVVSKVVLVALLSETVMLQARLSTAYGKLERERENKLTSAEAVVAAIAHEIRQPLAAMTANAFAGERFLDRASPDIAEAKDIFGKIREAGFRASEVFDNFLNLFRGGRKEHQPVNVNVLVIEAIQVLRKELDDHNIVAHTTLESELPSIQGNSGQLREVILNFCQNSIEAMATITKQRIINVTTTRHDSHSISISVQDTGPGIDPNKLASIFDPFVTTKAKGTGLGLAICKMIIEQHGGKLSASSDTHYGGARFEVTLPINMSTALDNKPLTPDETWKLV